MELFLPLMSPAPLSFLGLSLPFPPRAWRIEPNPIFYKKKLTIQEQAEEGESKDG